MGLAEAFGYMGPAANELRAWLACPAADKRIAVVQGPPGIGKTALLRALAADLNLEIVWASCSGVGALFGSGLAMVSESARSVDGRRKVLVFDEFEALGAADVAGLGKAPKVPCVFVAHTTRGLPRGAPVFRMQTPSPAAIAKILVAKGARRDAAKDIAIAADGDVRVALDMLATGITQRVRDLPEGLELAARILRGHCPESHDTLDYTAVSATFEQYPKAARDLAAVADGFSVGDVLDSGGCTSVLGVPEAHDVCLRTCASQCVAYGDMVTQTPIDKFGTLWSQASLAHAKRKAIGSGSRLGPEGQAAVRCVVMAHVARGDYAAAATTAVDAGVTSAGLLAVMRLWKTKYTLTHHSKVKKLMPCD